MQIKTILDTQLIDNLLALFTEEQQETLVELMMDQSATAEQRETAVSDMLNTIDWESQREQVSGLINELMPLETLVPDIYAAWRPVVQDAVAFVGAHLSSERLVPKLVEQMMTPLDVTLEKRLLMLIAQMPVLQKLGQVIARNSALDPAFRAELTRLENSIENITYPEIEAEIQRQLSDQIRQYQIELEPEFLAEASVSAVVPFTWQGLGQESKDRGVLKVIKPYVLENFPEELAILRELTAYFEERQAHYQVSQTRLREVIEDVCHLLERELDLPNEQKNLADAQKRYAHDHDIRVPRLITELCTAQITAMTYEPGVKVTAAYASDSWKRNDVARQLIKTLIANPIFTAEERVIFHADIHAGNLLVDEATGHITLLDWALVSELSQAQCREIILLTTGLLWRDSQRVYHAVAQLIADDLADDEAKSAMVRGHITRFIEELSPVTIVGLTHTVALLDRLALAGIRFEAPLLLFRKMLFTLSDILHEIAPDVNVNHVLAFHMAELLAAETPDRLRSRGRDQSASYRSHFSSEDLAKLAFNLPLLGQRLLLQTNEAVATRGARKVNRIMGRSVIGNLRALRRRVKG